MNDKFLTVHTDHFAFLVFKMATHNGNGVVFANGHVFDIVFTAKFGGEGGTHDDTTFVGRGSEVSLTGLSAGGGD